MTTARKKTTDTQPLGIRFHSPSGMGGYGSVLTIDGREIPNVRSVSFHAPADDIVTAHIEVIAHESLDVTLGSADTTFEVVAVPGCELEVFPQPDGSTRFRSRLVAPSVDTDPFWTRLLRRMGLRY